MELGQELEGQIAEARQKQEEAYFEGEPNSSQMRRRDLKALDK